MARGRTGDRLGARTRGGLATCPGRETGPPRAGRAAPGPARRFRQPPPGGAPGPPRGRRSGPTRTRRRTRESELTGWQGPRKLPATGPRPFPVAPAPPRARLGWWATRTGPGWGAGPAGGGPPPASYGGRAWPIPPAGPPPSELRRAIRRDRPGRSDLAGRRPARRDTPTPGRVTRVLPPAGSARWCPAAPSRPQPGTTNPSRKRSSLRRVRGAAGRPPGERQEGRLGVRCGNTSPDRAPRTSHKLVGPWGAPGPPIGAAPPASYDGGRCLYHRWVLRRPNSGAIIVTSARTVRTRRVAMPIGKGRPGHPAGGRPGGGCKRALVRKVLLKGGLQPPHSADASTTAGRDRIGALGRRLRQTGDVGWIANEAEPGGGGRSLARPAWRPATIHAAKGGTGRPPGGCKRALERTFFTRAACSPPRAIQGPKPFSNGLAPRSPATRARISSKAANPAESQGKRWIGAASTRIFR